MRKSCKERQQEELEDFCNNGCTQTNETLVVAALQKLAADCANITAILAEINGNHHIPSNDPGFGPQNPNSTTGGGSAPNGGGIGPGNGVGPSPNNIAFSGQCGPLDSNTDKNPYCCGVPGAVDPSLTNSNIGACNWSFSSFDQALASVYSGDHNGAKAQFRWVKLEGTKDNPTNTDCSTDGDCTSPEVCGTIFRQFIPSPNDFLSGKCGVQLGYWSANEICATSLNTTSNAFLKCSTGNNRDLYKCVGTAAQSCYTPGALESCCGCVNWKEEKGLSVAVGTDNQGHPFTNLCVKQNPIWQSKILESVLWLKSACPSAYVYPFDDMSSTFKCYSKADPNNLSNNNNIVNYLITSCPEIGMTPTTPPQFVDDQTRVFKFYNNCPYTVWPAMVGGTAKHKGFDPLLNDPQDTCSLDSECFPGATCIAPQYSSIKKCFWTNPKPQGGNYEVPQGGSVEFHMPLNPSDTYGIAWSGAMTVRTGCPQNPTEKFCDVADCRGFNLTAVNSFDCIPTQGFTQPATQAEIAVKIHDADYYDVEIINGVSVPLQMDPCVGSGHCFVS